MQPPHHHSRINLAELKAQIVKKLGPEGAKQYFHHLNKFLSLKLTKVEFDKLCLRILGRQNIPLHNQLIRSILRNACSAQTPPAVGLKDDVLKNGPQTMASPSGLSNGGDILPLSPRKVRTNRRSRSTLQHYQGHIRQYAVSENGALNSPDDLGRTLQHHHQGHFRQSVNESDTFIPHDRSPLQAPLGVPFCHISIGGAHRALPPSSSIGSFSDGALLDSVKLMKRMEQIALLQGLEGVSMDCANVLNHGLDVYMKGLIKSCFELTKSNTSKNQRGTKVINGVKPGYQYQMQNSGGPFEGQEQGPISLRDFRVAMEINRQKLGEDWPLLLEKICTHALEE